VGLREQAAGLVLDVDAAQRLGGALGGAPRHQDEKMLQAIAMQQDARMSGRALPRRPIMAGSPRRRASRRTA
jgi:hypothetical protein